MAAYCPAPYLTQPVATDRDKARRLARRLGCALSYYRSRAGGQKNVDITLPEGTKMAGTLDVDALHHECEAWEDIWPGVLDELQSLDLEPLAPPSDQHSVAAAARICPVFRGPHITGGQA